MYITEDEVRNMIGVTDVAIIPDATIEAAITWAEEQIDQLTGTTFYCVEVSGTATSATAVTIVDSGKSWTPDEYIGYAVYIYAGTGVGQIREITDNDATSLTVATWTTNPDATSKYYITYLNKVSNELQDGNNQKWLYLKRMPLVQVDALTVSGTSVSTDELYIYKDEAKIYLKQDAEVAYFGSTSNSYLKQAVDVTYHYGVVAENKRGTLSIPATVKRLCGVIAGLQALAYQKGGTYATLSTFSLPDFVGTIGQAHANITSVVSDLVKEYNVLLIQVVGKYYYIG